MGFWLVQVLNGLTFGMVLFLLAAGLSLIFGLMRIINVAHGCFYLLGGYIAYTVVQTTHSFLLALVCGTISAGLVGIVMQRFFLRRFMHDHMNQVLLTIGLVFIVGDLVLLCWGGEPVQLPTPEIFQTSIEIGEAIFPAYHLVIITTGLVMAIGLGLFQQRTKVGALIRAGVDDTEMAGAAGINLPLLFGAVFGMGAAVSAIGGIVAGPLIGVYSGLEWEIMLLAMAVLLIGGLGSLKGAFVGSLLVGQTDALCKVFMPELGLFIIFGTVAIVLAFRPEGFFGRV